MSRLSIGRTALPVFLVIALAGLSGCIVSSTGEPSEPVVRQATGPGIISTPHQGVQLDLTIPAVLQPGQSAAWQLMARHTGEPGSAPFGYSNICHSPWQVALSDAHGETLTWREPMPECAAYGTAYLEAGDSIGTTWEWDLRVWDATTETYADIEPGDYSLIFLFEKQDEETGRGGGLTATHRFTID